MAAGRYVRGLRPEQRLKVRPHRNACTYLAPTGEMQGATASRGECSQRQGCMHGGGAELDGRTVAALLADPGVARRVRGWLGGRGLEPWCVEVSRVSGSVEQCRGSVGAVSVDTGVSTVSYPSLRVPP